MNSVSFHLLRQHFLHNELHCPQSRWHVDIIRYNRYGCATLDHGYRGMAFRPGLWHSRVVRHSAAKRGRDHVDEHAAM